LLIGNLVLDPSQCSTSIPFRYLKYIEQLYQIIDKNIDPAQIDKKQLEKIRSTYIKMKRERGAEIKKIIHITRDEPFL